MKEKISWYSIDIQDILRELNTNLRGLTTEDSKSRLGTYGFNELKAKKRESPLKLLLNQFKSILILILFIATTISLLTGHIIDAIIIFIIIIISAIIGFSQEYRAEKALEALKKMLSPFALTLRDGMETEIPAKELVPGDVILLKGGDVVPADARLFEIINFQVNEASLTGESMPIRKETIVISSDSSLLDRKNMVFSGTGVTYGKGKAVVVATGMKTEVGKIAKQITTIIKEETPLERRTKELGKWFGLAALIIIIAIIIVGVVRRIPFLSILMFGIALAVAAVPEALPAIVIGSLAIGMYKMAKRNALVRKMSAVETLGSTTVICSDKTGTLTKGEMTVKKIFIDNKTIEISGVGYEPKGEFILDGNTELLQRPSQNFLMKGLLLCNDAELMKSADKWRIRGDPTEAALIVVAVKAGYSHKEMQRIYPRIDEFPFSSERKRMTTIHLTEEKDQYIMFMKGAPEVVLNNCNYIHNVDKIENLTENNRNEILKNNNEMANDALRVLAIAYRNIPISHTYIDKELLESDFTFLGLVGMIDPPRKEVIEAVMICKKVKIRPIMITGDHKLTATSIAKEIGIFQEGDIAMTGDELDKLDDDKFLEEINNITVYARVSPLHKLRIVEAWKRKGQIVAMTGDGVNDAPALKQANIGVAMGITGTEITKEAADLILTDDNFASIVKAIEVGRETYDNIKKYLTYLLQANLVEILVLSIAVLLGFPLPLLPIHILYINLATDGLPAIALGFSPSDPDIMERPPRPPNESIFTNDVKSFLLRAVLIEVPLLLLIFIASLPEGIEIARTRLFLVFIFFELIIALNCRSLKYNLVKVRPHRLLLIVIIWEIILIVILINIPLVREAFGIKTIGLIEIWLILFMCFTVFISIESTKWLLNRIKKKGNIEKKH